MNDREKIEIVKKISGLIRETKNRSVDYNMGYRDGLYDALDIIFESSEDNKDNTNYYSIEDIEKCVEHWGLCKVEKEYIEKFLHSS